MLKNALRAVQSTFLQPQRTYVRGVQHKLLNATLPKSTNKLEKFDTEDPEDISAYESDFFDVHKTHKQLEQEALDYQQKVKQWTVRQKYFKQKSPNFLTWAEKEQIRYLNASDPEEWNPQHLAECFPADEFTIKKIIKSSWQPKDETRIQKHDQSVSKTWELFSANKILDLDPWLREHLKKFTARTNITAKSNPFVKKSVVNFPTPKSNEFSSIITSCKGYKPEGTVNNVGTNTEMSEYRPKTETYVRGKVKDKQLTTLKRLQQNEHEQPNDKSTKDLVIENPNGTGIVPLITSQSDVLINVKKFDDVQIKPNEQDLKELSIPSIREFVIIPKRLFKEGATYRLGDCYYDDDGEFLYRVPGMIGRSDKK